VLWIYASRNRLARNIKIGCPENDKSETWFLKFVTIWRMVSSVMLGRVALTRATQRDTQEDTILHSHHRENLKFYMWQYNCLCVISKRWINQTVRSWAQQSWGILRRT
jgi:hypothetical protein